MKEEEFSSESDVCEDDVGVVSRRRFLQTTGCAAAGLSTSALQAQSNPTSTTAASAATRSATRRPVRLRVNGVDRELDIEARVTLLDALREVLALPGTKKGCDRGQCGACTVLVDGRRINSCLTLAVMQEGRAITTIEGLGTPEALHPVQAAFITKDAFQCGYCTPGQICSTVALLNELKAGTLSAATFDALPAGARAPRTVAITDAEIRERMSGNLCRCGAYSNIVAAVRTLVDGGST